MSMRLPLSATRLVSALAVSLALAAPAVAGPGYGPQGMQEGYGHCQYPPGYRHNWGDCDCPCMHGQAGPARMGGKMLGVAITDLPSAMLDAANLGYGVNVEHVQPESAAAAAGIRAGDVIVEFDGRPVFSADRLRWLVRNAEAGKGLDIKLMREGQPMTVNATLAAPAPKESCPSKNAPRLGT